MEDRCGYNSGQVVAVDPNELVRLGDRALWQTNVGVLTLAVDGTWQAPAPETPRALDDLRTLPLSFNRAGTRVATFSSAVEQVSQTPFPEWTVSGPRTSKWVLQTMVELEQTPSRRHLWWKQTLKLGTTDPGVEEHQFLSEVMECALVFDGLNICELQAFETIMRRFQMWEEVYGEKLRAGDQSTASMDTDERSLFLGRKFGRGQALVCPALSEYVSAQLKERSQVLKERRKAREEREGTDDGAGADQSGPRRRRGRGGQQPKADPAKH